MSPLSYDMTNVMVEACPNPLTAYLRALGIAPEASRKDLERLCAAVGAVLSSDDPSRPDEKGRAQFWQEKLSQGASSPWPAVWRPLDGGQSQTH
jgi:hypothetical protein